MNGEALDWTYPVAPCAAKHRRHLCLLGIIVAVASVASACRSPVEPPPIIWAAQRTDDVRSAHLYPVTIDGVCAGGRVRLYCTLAGRFSKVGGGSGLFCRIRRGPSADSFAPVVTDERGRSFALLPTEGLLGVSLPMEYLDQHARDGLHLTLAGCGRFSISLSAQYVAGFLKQARASQPSQPSPLVAAVIGGDHNMLATLLSDGADPNLPNDGGAYPLHVAATMTHREMVRLLVSSGADVHKRDEAGRTALHLAAIQGDTEVLAMLLRAGSDVNDKDSSGGLALGYAIRNKNAEAAEMLREHGGVATRDHSLRLGTKDYLLSARVQDNLAVARTAAATTETGGPWVLIVGEPHHDTAGQWDVFQGLTVLFSETPTLAQGTVFLAEGVAADLTLSIAPLLATEARPSDRLVRLVLKSYLVPGYVAYVWRAGGATPIVGVEDEPLYDASAALWAEGRQAGHIVTVAARNVGIARVVTAHVRKGENVVLFVGAGHVAPLDAVGFRQAFAVYSQPGAVPPGTDIGVWQDIRETRNVGVGDLLNEAGVSYTLLQAVHEDPPQEVRKNVERYRSVFRAQRSNRYAEYIEEFLRTRAPVE